MPTQFRPTAVVSLRAALTALCFAAIGAAQGPRILGVVNDFSRAPLLSPGVQAAIRGRDLTSGQVCQAQQFPLSTTLCETRVLVKGMPSPVASVSPTEVVAQFSFDLTPGSADVIVEADGDASRPFAVTLETHAPGIRTVEGTGFGYFLAPQRFRNGLLSQENPAQPGEVLTLFAVGLGPTEPPVPAGEAAPLETLAQTVESPTIRIQTTAASAIATVAQGAGLPILFSGLAPGIGGWYQVNFQLPEGLPDGEHQLSLEIGGQISNSVVLPVGATDPLAPTINAVVNAAHFGNDGFVSPGSIVTMFVSDLGTSEGLAVFPATEFEGLSVTFDGIAAPLFDVVPSNGQINLLAPSELEGFNSTVRVTTPAGPSLGYSVTLSDIPGIFRVSSSNPERQDGVVVLNNTRWLAIPDSVSAAIGLRTGCEASGISPTTFCGRPAQPNDALQIFATGLGRATPEGDPSGFPLPTGTLAPSDGNPLYQTVHKPLVTLGDIPAEVLFSGLTPGFSGLYQINIIVPAGVPAGDDVPLKIFIYRGELGDEVMLEPNDEVTIAIAP